MLPDAQGYLQSLADTILREAKTRIPGGPSGKAAAAITIESVTPTTIVIAAASPASYLITGWPQAPMTWLSGKRVAFVPKGGSAKIVRTVSPASLAAGHWVRPARAPDDVLGNAWAAPPTQNVAQGLADTLLATLSVKSGSSGARWAMPPSSFS